MSLVRIASGELLAKTNERHPFQLRFTPDGSRLFALGRSTTSLFDIPSFREAPVRLNDEPGVVGIDVAEKNGKLTVSGMTDGSPADKSSTVGIGDEIIAIGEGPEPGYGGDDRQTQWKEVIGWEPKRLLEALDGRPGTFVRIRLLPSDAFGEEEILLQRARKYQQDGNLTYAAFLDAKGAPLTMSIYGDVMSFRHVPSGIQIGCVRMWNIQTPGIWTLSPDYRCFGNVSHTRDEEGFGIEIHDLTSGTIIASEAFDGTSWLADLFSNDSREYILGTSDSIEIFDIEQKAWVRTIMLQGGSDSPAPSEDRLGLDLPDGLFARDADRVFPGAVSVNKLAISPTDILAVGSRDGAILFVDLKSGKRLGAIPFASKDKPIEGLTFTPDGRFILFFIRGTLHILEIAKAD